MRLNLCDDRGQASVELLGALPALLLAGLVCWQLLLAGQTLWLSGQAARAAARAEAVGRDPGRAARSVLPGALEHGLEVRRRRAGGVEVSLRVPLAVRHRPGPVRVSAASSFGGAGR